jgi:formylglycine-generating enzyme required for sulfatase activity
LPGAWRLPTKAEWETMVAAAKKQEYTDPALTNAAGTAQWTDGNAFISVQLVFYWSSTTYDGPWNTLIDEMDKRGAAWGVTMMVGYMDYGYKAERDNVWPVKVGH